MKTIVFAFLNPTGKTVEDNAMLFYMVLGTRPGLSVAQSLYDGCAIDQL